VFHLQLRQFPHNYSQFNLSADEVAPIVDAWAQDQWVEVGERKWSPHQAKLTIVEGPRIALAALSMGRGWRQAEREGRDVTQPLLADARTGVRIAATTPEELEMTALARGAARETANAMVEDAQERADAPSDDLEGLLGHGPDAAALLAAWRTVTARSPQLSPSERLALAELRLRTARADPSD
jgi:hypothetical protein